jgi:hypothetical protein
MNPNHNAPQKNTPGTPPNKTPTPLGGVAFERPETLPGAQEIKTEELTSEKVSAELSEAGIKPDYGTHSELSEKKAALTQTPAPQIERKPPPLSPPKRPPAAPPSPVYGNIPRLRTYKDDIARAIERNKTSGTDISIAEQKRKLERLEAERAELELKKKLEEDTQRLKKLELEERGKEKYIPRGAPQQPEEIRTAQKINYEPPDTLERVIAHPPIPIEKAPPAPPMKPRAITKEELERTIEETRARLETRSVAREKPIELQTPRRTFTTLLAAVALLILGAGAVGVALYLGKEEAPDRSPLALESLILAENTLEVPVETVSGKDLLGLLSVRIKEGAPGGGAITFVKQTLPALLTDERRVLTTQEWFERAETKADPALVRALQPTFMLGVHNVSRAPFLIFKTEFYENAFAGMLDWEKSMSRDLVPLFGTAVLDEGRPVNAPTDSFFVDRIIENKDTRVLIDLSGEIRLMYSFIDTETLVITTGRDAFLEILTRANATRTTR